MCNKLLGCLWGLVVALLLTACARPESVHPALWKVEGPGGQQAYLFGTIHALPEPVNWRSEAVEAALAGSDHLVLEVADINNDAATAQAFANLATGSQQPPLIDRVPDDLEDDLAAELQRDKIGPGTLDRYDTWAAALMIAQAQAQADRQHSANGIDRDLASGYRGPIVEFEGARNQLAIFDSLPEPQQRALLGAVLDDNPDQRKAQARDLARAWARGDMAAIAKASDADMFGDAALRDALLVGRNRTWTLKLIAMLKSGVRPFVAVGAAHLAGPDGLPEMLAARGYRLTRLQ